MARTYLEKDRTRGTPATFMWFMEEVGELSTALREGTLEEQKGEFADVYAWLMTLANLAGVDMQEALAACQLLAKMPEVASSALPALKPLTTSSDVSVGQAAQAAITRITSLNEFSAPRLGN